MDNSYTLCKVLLPFDLVDNCFIIWFSTSPVLFHSFTGNNADYRSPFYGTEGGLQWSPKHETEEPMYYGLQWSNKHETEEPMFYGLQWSPKLETDEPTF